MRKSVQFAAAVLVLVGSVASGGEIFFPGGQLVSGAPAYVALTAEAIPPLAVAGNPVFQLTAINGGVLYTCEGEVKMGLQRYNAAGLPENFPVWHVGATAPAAVVPPTGGTFLWAADKAALDVRVKAWQTKELGTLKKDLEAAISKEADAKAKTRLEKLLKELLKEVKKADKKAEAPKADAVPAAEAKADAPAAEEEAPKAE